MICLCLKASIFTHHTDAVGVVGKAILAPVDQIGVKSLKNLPLVLAWIEEEHEHPYFGINKRFIPKKYPQNPDYLW